MERYILGFKIMIVYIVRNKIFSQYQSPIHSNHNNIPMTYPCSFLGVSSSPSIAQTASIQMDARVQDTRAEGNFYKAVLESLRSADILEDEYNQLVCYRESCTRHPQLRTKMQPLIDIHRYLHRHKASE